MSTVLSGPKAFPSRRFFDTTVFSIFVSTGSGLSAESGVATFRDADRLLERHNVAEVPTPEGFAADPDLVQRFYDERRARLATVEPNAAHRALADLESRQIGRAHV